jgi:Leucine-rich repeat (LRR) protein
MELDISSFADNTPAESSSSLRSRNVTPVPTREDNQPRHSITGERPNLFPGMDTNTSNNPSNRASATSIFDQRRDDGDNTFGVNLMDHDTGIYKEPTTVSGFMDSFRKYMANRRAVDPHDASPAEPDFLGDNLYASNKRHRFATNQQRTTPLFSSCRDFCVEHKERRNLCLMVCAGIALLLFAVMAVSSGSGGSSFTMPHAPVNEKVMRAQNDVRFNAIMDQIVLHGISHTDAFLDYMNPEYHAIRWVSYSDPAALEPADPILLQRYALAVFFYSSYLTFETIAGMQSPVVNGDKQWEGVPNPGWVRKDFWMTESGHCKWFGVTCEPKVIEDGDAAAVDRYDENGPVWGLNLTDNHVMGTLPPEFKALDNLYSLDLSHNKMSGTFPWQVARMFQLSKVYMHHNRLTGVIPEQIGFLEGAKDIRLGNNQLTGTIPSEINRLYNLESLALDHNRLTGIIPQMYNMHKLKYLYLDHNTLGGHFPYSLVRVTSLFEIHLNDNAISGTIAPELETLRHLRILAAENNQIAGKIPDGMFIRLNHLTELTLQNNKLSGSLPTDMGSEQILRIVQLSNNQIKGSIPEQWDTMIGVERLHLQQNLLTGRIPTHIGTMTNLQELWVQNNKLGGILPTEIGLALALKTVYIEHNAIEGRVPTQMGTLENLSAFRMFDNLIRGYMPDDICNLADNFKLKSLSADCAYRGSIMKCDCCTKCY